MNFFNPSEPEPEFRSEKLSDIPRPGGEAPDSADFRPNRDTLPPFIPLSQRKKTLALPDPFEADKLASREPWTKLQTPAPVAKAGKALDAACATLTEVQDRWSGSLPGERNDGELNAAQVAARQARKAFDKAVTEALPEWKPVLIEHAAKLRQKAQTAVTTARQAAEDWQVALAGAVKADRESGRFWPAKSARSKLVSEGISGLAKAEVLVQSTDPVISGAYLTEDESPTVVPEHVREYLINSDRASHTEALVALEAIEGYSKSRVTRLYAPSFAQIVAVLNTPARVAEHIRKLLR